MINLLDRKEYPELITFCDESIQRFPQWYTSYIFKAMGLLNINDVSNRQKALDLIDFVSKNTIGDIDYSQHILKILLQLNEKNRVDEILSKISIDALQIIEDEELRDKLINFKKNVKF